MSRLVFIIGLALLASSGCGDVDAANAPLGGFGGEGGGVGGAGGVGGTEGNVLEKTLVKCDVLSEYDTLDGTYRWDLSAELEVEAGDAVVVAHCGQYNTRNGERYDYYPDCVEHAVIAEEAATWSLYCEQGSVYPGGVSQTLEFEAIYIEINTECARQLAQAAVP